MQDEKRSDEELDREEDQPIEEAEHPVPGVKHKHEPDAENLMPAEYEPGTL